LISIEEAFSHQLMMAFEILFIVLGGISIAIMVVKNHYFKKKEKLEI